MCTRHDPLLRDVRGCARAVPTSSSAHARARVQSPRCALGPDRQMRRWPTNSISTNSRRRATAAAQTWAPGCSISDVQPLTGGASSLTFTGLVTGRRRARGSCSRWRRRASSRCATATWRGRPDPMRALAGSPGVRVPTVYFEDDGAPPEVSPFHAMNIVPGECLEPILSEVPPEKLPLIPERAFGAARMLAALHRAIPTRSASAPRSGTRSKGRSSVGREPSRPSTSG